MIPQLYHHARIEDLGEKLRVALLAKPFEQGLLLWGPAGTGKTYSASALGYMYCMRGLNLRRSTFKQLVHYIRATYTKSNLSEQDVWRPLEAADVVILEDIAVHSTVGVETDFNQSTLNHLIDFRQENQKPTILTSNLSPENIEIAFGERLRSRLETFLIIKVDGRDLRAANE